MIMMIWAGRLRGKMHIEARRALVTRHIVCIGGIVL
jgi:hypothetical protein